MSGHVFAVHQYLGSELYQGVRYMKGVRRGYDNMDLLDCVCCMYVDWRPKDTQETYTQA